ncbi:MAG: serine hydrolase domain-containing protein [Planctomycetota bacterium]
MPAPRCRLLFPHIAAAAATAACIALSHRAVPAQTVEPAQQVAAASALKAKLDGPFEKAFPKEGPAAAVIVKRGDETVYLRAFGQASLELGTPATTNNVFCIASVTKPFTAMAVMALIEDGKLALTDVAATHLPELELDARITLEQLLAHTAGLPDFFDLPAYGEEHMHREISPQQLCLAAKGAALTHDPGAEHRYSNLHYALLAEIVARTSGTSWEEFLQARIFEPAGMTRSTYGRHDRIVPGLVSSYSRDEGAKWRRAQALSYTRGYGLGGLTTSVEDLGRWHDAWRKGRILKPATIARMLEAPTLADGKQSSYALGITVREMRGKQVAFHAGGIYGWRAMLVMIPEDEVMVAVLTARDADDEPTSRLAGGAAQLVAGR